MKTIPFFSDAIRIRPHTASHPKYIDREVSLREFANGRPLDLCETEDGELFARIPAGPAAEFILGPEA